MYQPIRLSPKPDVVVMESFSMDPVGVVQEINPFTEAVFVDGKNKMKPIEGQFQVIKDLLDQEIGRNQTKKESRFDPEKFIKNLAWKELEDRMAKIFGFRNVEIHHWNEQYFANSKDFESMELNCYTWPSWRYPIDGLVTDSGFYDSTKSINTKIAYSLGIIKELSAGELTAIFLHELGHNLDPALVDISYTETNILSKYLTDREGSINPQEKKVLDKSKNGKFGFLGTLILIVYGSVAIMYIIKLFIDFIESLTFNKEKAIAKIKEALNNDKEKFTRQTNQEAFADNFARMYGYGPQLISSFSKMKGYYDKQLDSRYGKEKARQRIVADIIVWSLKGVHKTDMHRAHSLVREYEADLRDPAIPPKVKEAIKQDLDELNKVIDEYLNSADDFSNQLNKIVLEELRKGDPEIPAPEDIKKISRKKKEAVTTESVESFNECIELFEERSAKVDKKSLRSLTPEERKIVDERFGEIGCSIQWNKHGYFAHTHRARSGYYPTLEKLPKKDVDFVSSTG
jgi:hypothetical protein